MDSFPPVILPRRLTLIDHRCADRLPDQKNFALAATCVEQLSVFLRLLDANDRKRFGSL